MQTITASPAQRFSSFDAYKHGYSSPSIHNNRGVRRPPASHSTHSHSHNHSRSRAMVTPKRIVVALLIAATLVAVTLPATSAFGRRSLDPSKRPSAVINDTTISVVVDEGDTLWSIARELEPKRDTREIVDQLVQARGTANVYAGETITWQR